VKIDRSKLTPLEAARLDFSIAVNPKDWSAGYQYSDEQRRQIKVATEAYAKALADEVDRAFRNLGRALENADRVRETIRKLEAE
jgi:hypothetical protein